MPTVRRADSLKTGRWPDHPRARRALAASHSPRSRRVAGVAPKPQGAVLEAHAQRDLHYAVLDVERVPVLDAPQLDGPGILNYALNDFDVSWIRKAAQMLYNLPLAPNDHAADTLYTDDDGMPVPVPVVVRGFDSWTADGIYAADRSEYVD